MHTQSQAEFVMRLALHTVFALAFLMMAAVCLIAYARPGRR